MKNNAELQKDVQDAIRWEPLLNAAEIGVTVKDGIVTLTGVVDNYTKKLEAEDATKNVAGVKAVVEKIEVKLSSEWAEKDDNDIAGEIMNAFKRNWQIPAENIKVKVENGWITLEGDVLWNFQKEAANDAVKHLSGVKGVSNNIEIKSEKDELIEKENIENALRRNWSISEEDIHVKVSNHKATLTGMVDSVYQKEEAGRIAWKSPGVWSVENELIVDYEYAMIT